MSDNSWTEAEGDAIRQATEQVFPALVFPEENALVVDMRFDDMAQMAEACSGKTWRELDGETLFTKFRSFAALATDEGFCAILPAFIVQSVIADDEYRVELKGTLMEALDVSGYRDQPREACDARLGRTMRRIIMLTPEQRWLTREFARIAYTVDPNWHLTLGGQFWETIATMDAPPIRSGPHWRRG